MLQMDFQPVSVDLKQVISALEERHGRAVTDVEAAFWLRNAGFVPVDNPLCPKWLGDEKSLAALRTLWGEM